MSSTIRPGTCSACEDARHVEAVLRETVRVVRSRGPLVIAETRYEAPIAFCDPWPFAFNLLGQDGFLRFFRVTICAKEYWLDVEPESWS